MEPPTGLHNLTHGTHCDITNNENNTFNTTSYRFLGNTRLLDATDAFLVFEKSIELFRSKFTSSEIIGTEWQRCVDDVHGFSCGRLAALGAREAGPRDARRERDARLDATSQYFFDGVLMGFYVETRIV